MRVGGGVPILRLHKTKVFLIVCCVGICCVVADAHPRRHVRPPSESRRRTTFQRAVLGATGLAIITTLGALWEPAHGHVPFPVLRATEPSRPSALLSTCGAPMLGAQRSDLATNTTPTAARQAIVDPGMPRPEPWKVVWRSVGEWGVGNWEHQAPIPGQTTAPPQFTAEQEARNRGRALQQKLDRRVRAAQRSWGPRPPGEHSEPIPRVQLGIAYGEMVTPIPPGSDSPTRYVLERRLARDVLNRIDPALRAMGVGENGDLQIGAPGTLSLLPINALHSSTLGRLSSLAEYDRHHTTVSADQLALKLSVALTLGTPRDTSKVRVAWAEGLERLARINGHELQFAQPLRDLRSIGDRALEMLAR